MNAPPKRLLKVDAGVMSTTGGSEWQEPSSSTSDAEVRAPLLIPPAPHGGAESSQRARASAGARYLQGPGSGRRVRMESMLVRESAREQLQERQSDWAYSRPVVVLDLVWNAAFAIVALVVLVLSRSEAPAAPLRVWVAGYVLQCAVHMLCVWSEYRRRRRRDRLPPSPPPGRGGVAPAAPEGGAEQEPVGENAAGTAGDASVVEIGDEEEEEEGPGGKSLAKRLESANTMFSFVWWIVGFWWILSGVGAGFPNAPLLSWLCTVFLAFDVFFVVFCVALACVIGIAVCCCLPCIIAILYAVADQEGASEEEISALPKFTFRRQSSAAAGSGGGAEAARKLESQGGGLMVPFGSAQEKLVDRRIKTEDAECCICLGAYDDGVDLRELPCMHHFHCTCIDKWLRTKPTCPLCKYDIVKGKEASSVPNAGTSASPTDSGGPFASSVTEAV